MILKTIEDLNLSKNDRESIKEAVAILRNEFPVEGIILFGSKARGTDDPESDIDLLVITSEHLSWRERDALTDALYDLQLNRDVVISVLIVSGEEWREGVWQVLPLRDEIDRYGVAA